MVPVVGVEHPGVARRGARWTVICMFFVAGIMFGGPMTMLSSLAVLARTEARPRGVASVSAQENEYDAPAPRTATPAPTRFQLERLAAATQRAEAVLRESVSLAAAPPLEPRGECPLRHAASLERGAGSGLDELQRPLVHRKVFPLGSGGNRFNATVDVWRGGSSYAQAAQRAGARTPQLPRVLCWILAHGPKHADARRVARTWGSRCDCLVFISDKDDSELHPVVWALPHEGSIEVMITKTLRAWRYVYEHFASEYDYFLKADTDTYVVVDNLRYFLLQPRFTQSVGPHFIGRQFNFTRYGVELFHAGGPGYVLNRAALELLMCSYLHDRAPYAGDGGDDEGSIRPTMDARLQQLCARYPAALATASERALFATRRSLCVEKAGNHEDVMTARCLRAYGVYAEDTRDARGGERFLPLGMSYHYNPQQRLKGWFKKYSPSDAKPNGAECCAKMVVSFHGVAGSAFDVIEQGLYPKRS